MTLQNDITNAVADFQATRDIMRQIVNGDSTTVVSTDNGPVKSLAKAIHDLEVSYAAIGVILQTQGYKLDAYAWANNPTDAQYTDTDGAIGYSAKHWADKSKASEEAVAEWMLAYGRNEVQVVTDDTVADDTVRGFLLSVDTSAGDVRVDLSSIATLGEPYSVRVVKTENSPNRVAVYGAGADTINGLPGPLYITVKGQGYRFDSDADPDPDNWSAVAFGAATDITEQVYHFVATEGQTEFSGADRDGKVLGYIPGSLIVYRGIGRLWPEDGDFVASDGAAVVLDIGSPAVAGEEIKIVTRSAFSVADHWTKAEADARFLRLIDGIAANLFKLAGPGTDPAHPVNKAQFDALNNRAYVETGNRITATSVIPLDDTPMQSNEGAELLSVAFTPSRVGAVIEVDAILHASRSAAGWIAAGIFASTGTDAVAQMLEYTETPGAILPLHGRTSFVAASTEEITFSVRFGNGAAAGSVYVNGDGSIRYFGGALKASLLVKEVA